MSCNERVTRYIYDLYNVGVKGRTSEIVRVQYIGTSAKYTAQKS